MTHGRNHRLAKSGKRTIMTSSDPLVFRRCDLHWSRGIAKRTASELRESPNALEGALYYAGHSCCPVERVCVHRGIYDSFLEQAAEAWQHCQPGDQPLTIRLLRLDPAREHPFPHITIIKCCDISLSADTARIRKSLACQGGDKSVI